LPKRTDIEKILLIGSGPIVIGQACEFDYSGAQACKVLRQEGYYLILVNSNPATIMTDPELADRTYIEPITPDMVAKIIARERPDVLLPTLGGQTGLNLAVELAESGVLDQYGVELIGAKLSAIKKAENRDEFKAAMQNIGLELPHSGYARSLDNAWAIMEDLTYPVIIRPSFTLGGSGGNIAYNKEEFKTHVRWGLDASPKREILIEESVIGWKEYELEVMRDLKDNVVIICSIENFDPMGVHTGDSITVAPAQTLSDKEYQIMRDAAIKCIREIGVETGGSNIQFAVDPKSGRLMVIEMNPRVSRSSALASKATGFPIAKIAAKLAVGYTLDEIPNDITRKTPACFEPAIDYCVVKFPRFAFDKFPKSDQTLTTQMKSVGEVMAIGRTFKESLQKAIRSLEVDRYGLHTKCLPRGDYDIEQVLQEKKTKIIEALQIPRWERVWFIADALRLGFTVDEISQLSGIDAWFLENINQIVQLERELKQTTLKCISDALLRKAKEYGFSDIYLAELWNISEEDVFMRRKASGIVPVFKLVDTCAAEFEAYTPYLYSTYETECEANPTNRQKIVILGGGPNRIGQGIEFDYCCVHAAFALKEDGYETIMVNCNPETVSTDYDTSDRLYFEPLTTEDIINIIEKEKPLGVIVQFGGQTPLKLATALAQHGVNIIGTSPDDIDRAEDRERFKQLLHNLGLKQPQNGTAKSYEQAQVIAARIGYPVLVRPSYVLGGRAMRIVYDEMGLSEYMRNALDVSPKHPVLIDKFLENASELDVDAVADGVDVIIGGVMEHIEEAGIHSGDSACSLPPYSIPAGIIEEVKRQTRMLAQELKVKGLINIQFAVQGGEIYILEVNPRASRTVPFVSKAIGVPLAKVAARVMAGKSLKEIGFVSEVIPQHLSVKEAVFPFIKFSGVDTLLGPEMMSTGEVMGMDEDFAIAFAKAQSSIGLELPLAGVAFISVRDDDKLRVVTIAKDLVKLGFRLLATSGTQGMLSEYQIPVEAVSKASEGRPNIVDYITNGDIDILINTPEGKHSQQDSYLIRRAALMYNVPYFTTISGAAAAVAAIKATLKKQLQVKSLQEYHEANNKSLACKT
jgi:carbamoyl-phosphate synthase large subunit